MQSQLASKVERVLADFVEAARGAFGDRLNSIVLFGSAAEGRLRAASDVNIIVVLTQFQQSDAGKLAPSLALARVAVNLKPMFLLAAEIPAAAECFAQKFTDISRRHRVLYGANPFEGLVVPRAALIFRLRQVLLNMAMRLRESYAERAGRSEQLARLAAETSGALRTCASALLELETGVYHAPKEALTIIVQSAGRAEWTQALAQISSIREGNVVAPDAAAATVAAILEMSAHLRERTEKLK